MSEENTHDSEELIRKRRSRRAIRLLLFGLLCLGGWYGLANFSPVDRMKAMMADAITSHTHLPARIGGLTMSFSDGLRLILHDVAVDDGKLRVEAGRVILTLDPASLVRRLVNVTAIVVADTSVTLPGDPDVLEEYLAIWRADSGTESGSSFVVVNVNKMTALNLDVSLDKTLLVQGDVQADWNKENLIALDITGATPALGSSARVKAELALTRPDAGLFTEITGVVDMTEAQLASLFPIPAAPGVTAAVRAEVKGSLTGQVRADLAGQVASGQVAESAVAALAGAFTGTMWWARENNAFTLNGLTWQAPGGDLAANATWYLGAQRPGGNLLWEVTAANINAQGLTPLLKGVRLRDFGLNPSPSAMLQLRGVRFGLDGWRLSRVAGGSGSLKGVELEAPGGQSLGGVTFSGAMGDGVISIDKMSGQGFELSGSLRPNGKTGGFHLDVMGDVTLRREFLMLAGFPPDLDASGSLHITRMRADLPDNTDAPRLRILEGGLKDGKMSYGEQGQLAAGMQVTFQTDGASVRMAGECLSTHLGTCAFDADYDPDVHAITGWVGFDVRKIVLPGHSTEDTPAPLQTAMELYGDSRFDIRVALPAAGARQIACSFARQGTPALSGSASFTSFDEGWRPTMAQFSGALPLAVLTEEIPDGLVMTGEAPFTAGWDANKPISSLLLNFAPCEARWGTWLTKKPGDACALTFDLDTKAGMAIRGMDLNLLGVQVTGAPSGEGLSFSLQDARLESFSSLFPSNARVSGGVRGVYDSGQSALQLQLCGAAIAIRGEGDADCVPVAAEISGQLESRSGARHITGGRFTMMGVEYALEGALSDETRRLHIKGASLKVEDLISQVKRISAFMSSQTSPEAASHPLSSAPPPFVLSLDVGRLAYRRAMLSDARTDITLASGETRFDGISGAPYTGSLNGKALWKWADGHHVVDLDLRFRGMDLKFVDDLFYDKPHGYAGATDGEARLSLPFEAERNPFWGASGDVSFIARNGGFGPGGSGAQLLALLRTTEVFRLRAPDYKDGGLAFDTCKASLHAEKGLWTLRSFESRNPTFMIEAMGAFNEKNVDVKCDIAGFGGIASLMEAAGLDKGAAGLQDISGVKVRITGPPTNTRAMITGTELTGRIAEGAVRGGGAIIGAIGDAAGRAFEKVTGR